MNIQLKNMAGQTCLCRPFLSQGMKIVRRSHIRPDMIWISNVAIQTWTTNLQLFNQRYHRFLLSTNLIHQVLPISVKRKLNAPWNQVIANKSLHFPQSETICFQPSCAPVSNKILTKPTLTSLVQECQRQTVWVLPKISFNPSKVSYNIRSMSCVTNKNRSEPRTILLKKTWIECKQTYAFQATSQPQAVWYHLHLTQEELVD